MEKSREKSVISSINSKLRYPLRSSIRSKEGKPPLPDFSTTPLPKRGRGLSVVSQSTTVLDLSAVKKSVDLNNTKPQRRLSIPSNSSVKSVTSSVTSLSEAKTKRSTTVVRSVTKRKVEDLSSSTYWLSHIKLAESVGKHLIAIGFFKLALHAKCEPLEKMKEELKAYVIHNNMDGLGDAMKEVFELYNILDETRKVEVSEGSSVVVTEETTVSDITLEMEKEDPLLVKEEQVSETIPEGRSERSLDEINVNASETNIQEVAVVTVAQPSDKKPATKKESVSKSNSQPVKTRKRSVANLKTVSETKDDKTQKKSERMTKPRTKKTQQVTKKPIKKQSAAKEGKESHPGEVASLKQIENKENSVVAAAEEIKI